MNLDWPALLIAAYVVPLAVAAWWLAVSSSNRWWAVLLLAVLPVFYAFHYHGVTGLAGWPAREPLPPQFELLAEEIAEPGGQPSPQGYIRLWVRLPDDPRSRLYELPYSRSTHEAVDAAARVACVAG